LRMLNNVSLVLSKVGRVCDLGAISVRPLYLPVIILMTIFYYINANYTTIHKQLYYHLRY
jgi:hypothetical protein